MLRGLDVLISCCVAIAVGDLGSDLDSELCQSDDCAAKQARTGLAAANDDDLQDPNTIAVKDADADADADEDEENDASDANNAFVRVRRGGCFDNKQHGKANHITQGGPGILLPRSTRIHNARLILSLTVMTLALQKRWAMWDIVGAAELAETNAEGVPHLQADRLQFTVPLLIHTTAAAAAATAAAS